MRNVAKILVNLFCNWERLVLQVVGIWIYFEAIVLEIEKYIVRIKFNWLTLLLQLLIELNKFDFDPILDLIFRFDTTDDDEDVRKDDPAPLIPTPTGFTPDCSVLDNVSILFLNTNILLELRYG